MSNVPRQVGPEDADEDGILHLWYDPDDIDDDDDDDIDDDDYHYGADSEDDDDEGPGYCEHGISMEDACAECEPETRA